MQNNRVFVIITPCSMATGGPEALHQLAHELNAISNLEALTYYVGERDLAVTKTYQDIYNIHETKKFDVPNSVVVIPEEIDPAFWPTPTGGRKWMWWLSAQRVFPLSHYKDCSHLFQSEHARIQMAALGFYGIMLTDYISEQFFSISTVIKKKNLIAFNGTKSTIGATILKLTDLSLPLVPIRNLNTKQVFNTLSQAKIYLDFGWHPGRDRLPREAALCNCLIVSNYTGAAGNSVDLPIPLEYKIAQNDTQAIINTLRRFISEYDTRIGDFSRYQQWVRSQRSVFQQEVRHFVDNDNHHVKNDEISTGNLINGLDLQLLYIQEQLQQLRQLSQNLSVNIEAIIPTFSIKIRFFSAVNRFFRLARRLIIRLFRL